jgi:hypothetical protein
MKIIPDLSANIRVTVTMETATGIRREEFAISSILGCVPKRIVPGQTLEEEYRDVFWAKVNSAAAAAAQAVMRRVKPDTWRRLEEAGAEELREQDQQDADEAYERKMQEICTCTDRGHLEDHEDGCPAKPGKDWSKCPGFRDDTQGPLP